MRGRVLVVDDDLEMCKVLELELQRLGFEIACQPTARQAFDEIATADFDAVVADLHLQGMNGLELCERVVANRADVPVIVVTAYGSMETAIAAIRAGAYDFVTKPFEVEQLALALDRAVQHHRLGEEVRRLRRAVADSQRCEQLLGSSSAMRTVFDLIGRLADSEASVLITGETGTGKELAARALHRKGRRTSGPFIAINCAAVPETLLESQLFGHVKGAFTDARESRPGLLVQASGGTLFLDEIGDMPLALQPKLLRTLQDRVVRPLGGSAEVPFDARIIASTNCELEDAVEDGRFRLDLFFRINVVHVHMPSLRARSGDVLLLAQHFIDRLSAQAGKKVVGLSSAAAERLLAYAWPGNVRELQNCIERAVALTTFERLVVEDLPEKIRSYHSSHIIVAGEDPTELVPMAEVERRYVLRVLEAVGGNKAHAARVLGYNRRTLYRKLGQYGAGEKRDARAS